MDQVPNLTILMVLCLMISITSAETEEARLALVKFMNQLSSANGLKDANWGWNETSDPCIAAWKGVDCRGSPSVKKLVLDQLNLTGVFDAKSLCAASSMYLFSMNDNKVGGNLPEEISNCTGLTHLFLQENNFSGNLPASLSRLNNLKRLDISNNDFSGDLPNVSRISGLITFRAENNHLTGGIPIFDFTNLQDFNVSNNNFSGPIPQETGQLPASSFLGNDGLCGPPLPNPCPDSPNPSPPPPPEGKTPDKKKVSSKKILIYFGYALLGALIIGLLIAIKCKKKKKKKKKKQPKETVKANALKEDFVSSNKPSTTSTESKIGGSRSEFSLTSPEHGKATSLVILSSPVSNGLKFEDLLRAPAELIGRGSHGTLYKVILNTGLTLAVKRIKDWDLSRNDFKKRMQRIDIVKHQNVLPPAAYYCSKQEKLLVYEFQKNGSLFRLLHGSQHGETFDWGSRLSVAARSANAMAFMHEKLQNDDIAHWNLKSSNIMMNKDMEPCISEYGLMEPDNQDQQSFAHSGSLEAGYSTNGGKINGFKADIYAFGVILLELLTGKLVHNRRSDLARWVNSVVREEWTAEVFDKGLVKQGASEERMVALLQVALKCISPTPDTRPNMSQVALMINAIREEEEKSMTESAQT